jgi:hypothetical protein
MTHNTNRKENNGMFRLAYRNTENILISTVDINVPRPSVKTFRELAVRYAPLGATKAELQEQQDHRVYEAGVWVGRSDWDCFDPQYTINL